MNINEKYKSPWRVGPVDDTRVEDAKGNEVALIDGDYNDPDTWHIMESNARLISASPELLVAGIAQTSILHRAQAIMTNYLQGPPKGLNAEQAINNILGLLDGPDQREAQMKWDLALKKSGFSS